MTPGQGAADDARVEQLQRQLEVRDDELKHLMIDLALKDEFAVEQRALYVRAEQQRGQLTQWLEQANADLTSCHEELARLRPCESELRTIKNGSGYRVLVAANTRLSRHRMLIRAARWTARLLAGRS